MPSAHMIAVMNRTTMVPDSLVEQWVKAVQKQINQHWYKEWGIGADLYFKRRRTEPSPGHWWIVIADNSDVANALGYHDITPDGLPIGKVFAATTMNYASQPSVVLSHEVLEMLADPAINDVVFVQKTNEAGTLWAKEVCDAVQSEDYAYEVDGVLVSNFQHREYFEDFHEPGSKKFDHMGVLDRPFSLAMGGYMITYPLSGGQGWQNIYRAGDHRAMALRPQPGSRRDRRRTARDLWVPSDPNLG